MSIILSTQGVPMLHVTIAHDALDLTVNGPLWPWPLPCAWTPICTGTPDPLCIATTATLLVTSDSKDLRPVQTCSHENPTPMLVITGGQDWRPVQTCSCEDPVLGLTSGDICEAHMVGEWVVRFLLECFLVMSFSEIWIHHWAIIYWFQRRRCFFCISILSLAHQICIKGPTQQLVRHFRRRILKKTFDSLYMWTDGAENESLEFLLKVHFFAVGQYLADRFLITKSLCVKKEKRASFSSK